VGLVVIIDIQFDGVPAPAIFYENASVVIPRTILHSATVANKQSARADFAFLEGFQLEGVTLFPGKLFHLRVDGEFFLHSLPIRAADDGESVVDAARLRVFVFLVMQVDVLVVTVLIEGECDIGILPPRYRLAAVDEPSFFIAFLVIEQQSGELHPTRLFRSFPTHSSKARGVGQDHLERAVLLSNVDLFSIHHFHTLGDKRIPEVDTQCYRDNKQNSHGGLKKAKLTQ